MALRDQRLQALRDQARAALRSTPDADAALTLASLDNLLHELQAEQDRREALAEELRHAHAALQDSGQRYRKLLDCMNSGVAVYEAVDEGRDFVFVDFNPSACRIDEVERGDVVGKRVTEAFPGVEEFGLLDVFRSVWETGAPSNHPIRLYKDDRIAGWRDNYVYKLPSGEIVAVYDDVTREKQSQEELGVRSEIVTNMAEGAHLIRLDTGQIVYANPSLERMFGYRRGELVGRHLSLLNAPGEESAEEVAAQIIGRLKKTGKWSGEVRNVRKDGSVFWTQATVLAFEHTEYGQVCVTVQEDTTEQRKATEEIERLARFPAENPNPVMRVAGDGTVLYANDASAPLLDFWQCGTGDTLSETWQTLVSKALDAGEPRTGEVQCGDTTYALTFAPLADPAVVNVYGLDISERRESEERFRATFEQAAVGIAHTALGGRFERLNDRFCDIVGYTREELQARSLPDITHSDDLAEDEGNIKLLLQGDTQHYSTRKRYVREDGGIVWVNLTVSLVRKPGGEPRYFIAVVEDVTALMEAQEAAHAAREEVLDQQRRRRELAEEEVARIGDELIRTTRLATVGQVSASIAHDLRNPLGAIRNASYYLKRHLPDGHAELAEHLGIIDEEVSTADTIISNLLRMVRAKPPALQDVDLAHLLKPVLAKAARDQTITCHACFDPDPFVIQADPGQMQQVLTNLLDNAVAAVAGDGVDVRIEARRDDDFHTVLFRDTGAGVPASVRRTLFEPLVTTRAKGTGLGLTICQQIVQAHGGTIELLETPGPGAALRIQLPRRRPGRRQT